MAVAEDGTAFDAKGSFLFFHHAVKTFLLLDRVPSVETGFYE